MTQSEISPSTKENPCACGSTCKCKLANDKSQCKCGSACKCKLTNTQTQCKCGNHCLCHTMKGMESVDDMSMMHNHSDSTNPFLKIMDKMMVSMDDVHLTGSIERDFLILMIPHHQAAIEMAQYEIAHGKNFEMIQLAKSILAEQQGEIMDMQVMLESYPSEEGKVNADYKAAMDKTMEVMMNTTPTEAQLPEGVDCCFAQIMLPHHRAAIDMALVMLKFNPKSPLAIYAQRIIGDQQAEIDQMNEYVNKNCKQ